MVHRAWLGCGLKMASILLEDVGGGKDGVGSFLGERMWFSLGVLLSLP